MDNLEAYFHNDPQIREWTKQIMETILSACLLTGVDSDAEFQKGCQFVIKLTSSLQKIPELPSEFLEDIVKQLIEQQLPDARVIDSLPTFQPTMDRMLREGILKVACTPKKEAFKKNIAPHATYTERPMEVSPFEFVTVNPIPALATVNIPYPNIKQMKAETQAKADAQALAEAESKFEAVTELEQDVLIKTPALVTSIHSKTSSAFGPLQVPTQAYLLKHVLSNIFPKGTIYWNKSLMGQTFLAQVENILICIHDPEHPCDLKKYNKDGWKVLVCSSEDLTFPRRLERAIRQIQRLYSEGQNLNRYC